MTGAITLPDPIPVRVSDMDPRLMGVARLLALYDSARRTPDSAIPDVRTLELRPMTTAEKAGYALALDTIQTFAAQLEAGAAHLSDDADDAISRTPRQAFIERVRFAGDLARAQQLGFFGRP